MKGSSLDAGFGASAGDAGEFAIVSQTMTADGGFTRCVVAARAALAAENR